MLNKKRQELIIQNLNSISSQVRLMSVEQLTNLPSMPPQEKIKYLEKCLQDSEESVQNAAKKAIAKLGGNVSESPMPKPVLNTDSNSFANNSSSATPATNGFDLPSLIDVPNDNSNQDSINSILPPIINDSSEKLGSIPSMDQIFPSGLPDLSSLSEEPSVPSNILPKQNPKPVGQSVAPIAPVIPSVPPVPAAPMAPSPIHPMPQIQNTAPMTVESPDKEVVTAKLPENIDGPVDPSLPQITNATDIAFLIQHSRDVANQKPAGYLTRLFELAKSVHEEVALTALQNLFNLKDQRVPPHVLGLLTNSSYTSQRRFLMLKIVMDAQTPLNVDLLENILVNEKDVIIKSGLVKVFAKNCDQRGVPLLIRCLNDEDPRVRANTVEVIESQKIKGCEQEIIKLLNDSENRVKVNAAKYLVKIGYQQAFLTLRSMLVSPEVWLRDSVIFALGEIADQASLILLRAALKDPNQGIRLSVLKSLAKINNNMARQILKAACGDPDPIVAQVAMQLFEKIKNTPLREDKPVAADPALMAKTNASNNQTTVVSQPSATFPAQGKPVVTPQPQAIPPVNNTSNARTMNMPSMGMSSNTPSVPPAGAMPSVNPQVRAPQPEAAGLSNGPVLPNVNVQTTSNQGVVQPNANQPVLPRIPGTQLNAGVTSNTANLSRPVAAPVPPTRPVMAPKPSVLPRPQQSIQPPPNLPPGSPNFEKPRSAAIYAKLCSSSVDEQRNGMKDVAFVMGQDQMILLAKAIKLQDESIRITAVRVLSRKRTPEAKEMLVVLSQDTNETVSSLAKKALMLMR